MTAAGEIYRGAARYYATHITPFSHEIFRSLARVCRLAGSSRALDLGAGTGLFSIPLARSVGNVLSVDPCDEMLQEGRLRAEILGIKNIDFLVSRSEDLIETASSFDIATIANSFNWMDRPTVLAKLAKMLTPDGCIAIVNSEYDESEPGDWRDGMWSAVEEFWKGSLPPGRAVRSALVASDREVLRASEFSEITELRHYFERHRNVDDVLGYLHSMSFATPHVLGARREEFTRRIRQLLLSYSPSGSFVERGHVTTLVGYRP
ncbi:class I SAM-dependent methyltransferase [Bradyrhizobium sp. STM 3562]|uniref:class I SAM-dependent methyltransferase n=1 Tax=Bradyrhizobium sp. STM 3562 TaxID=578924 RepID=UPI00388D11D9